MSTVLSRRRRTRGLASSSGYRRARREAAELHQKAANQNKHVGRSWAKAVVDNHQLIAVEDFEPEFLSKTTMARKSADAAIGAAKRDLIERGTRAGGTVVLVPPAYTTMTCSSCWERQAGMDLSDGTFRCANCGPAVWRDLNAARVILATGERIRAHADDVRHLLASSGPVVGAIHVRNPRPFAVGNR